MVCSYIIFASEDLIPLRIGIHAHPGQDQPADISLEQQWARELTGRDLHDLQLRNQLPLEEVLDPYLEKSGAIFGGIVFALTLVAILVTNAFHVGHGVFVITVPAAFLMFCRDLIYDWWMYKHRDKASQATSGRDSDIEPGRVQNDRVAAQLPQESLPSENGVQEKKQGDETQIQAISYPPLPIIQPPQSDVKPNGVQEKKQGDETQVQAVSYPPPPIIRLPQSDVKPNDPSPELASDEPEITASPQSVNRGSKTLEDTPISESPTKDEGPVYADTRRTLYGLCKHLVDLWKRLPFPTVKAIISHLPFALVPFAFCMFIIVEGLVTKGWVELLAKGWGIWANKSSDAIAIAGMGFLSVCFCNVSKFSLSLLFSHPVPQFAGTNIGATILLSRVLQSWLREHTPSDRMVHGTVR